MNGISNASLVILPYTAISSHVNVIFICQTVNLFGCQSTVTEHPNLCNVKAKPIRSPNGLK